MATPLLVNVVELLRHPGTTKEVLASVAVEDLVFDDPRVTGATVEVALVLDSLTNGITVHGTARAGWRGECRRCLVPLDGPLECNFDELWQTTLEDPDAWRIEGDQIDLLPMVREGLLLAVPAGPLCRADCPGICALCGRDLAEGECGCDPAPPDARWSALEDMRGRLPEGG
jgi:uncharacterized protein